MIDKGICDKEFIWNPSNCECECDRSYDIGEYLDDENCKCRKKLVDKLFEECTENIEEAKIGGMALFEHGNECLCFYTGCVVLTVTPLTISVGIGTYFAYKCINNWYLKKMLLGLSLVPILIQQFNELIHGTSQRNKH